MCDTKIGVLVFIDNAMQAIEFSNATGWDFGGTNGIWLNIRRNEKLIAVFAPGGYTSVAYTSEVVLL